MNAVIFANGNFVATTYSDLILKQAELIIAADNGARYCLEHGVLPDVLVGDLDSLCPRVLKELQVADTRILLYPSEKNATDLELALDHLLTYQSVTDITILGALGGRFDMSLSNIFLTSHPKYQYMKIKIIDHQNLLYIINAHHPLFLSGRAGDTISLLPLTSSVEGIETLNLRYALKNETLYAASTRGISNQLTNSEAKITVNKGVLLCVHSIV
ncbi:MAG: thiamine diphosphokinase [Legionellales bacterium]|nr:thiamine diphosphokinase [Legionellales bacterium]